MKKKNNRGFTLIELLAVITIMGILIIIGIPAVTRIIENVRKDMFVNLAKEYVDGVKTTWISDQMQCGSTNTNISSLEDGDYYILIDTADENRLGVLEEDGKSPWGNREIKGYVRVKVETINSKQTIKFYIALTDGIHGIYDDLSNPKEADKLVRGDLIMNLSEASQKEILKKIQDEPFVNGNVTTCSLNGQNWSVTPPKSFTTDSWNTIVDAIRKGNTDLYNVGDEKEITLDGYGTHILRIANKSTPAECSNPNFSQTACGFVLEFKGIITTRKMNNTSTNVGGWEASKMRTFVNDTIYNSLPAELRSVIKETKVISGHGNTDTNNFATIDKLYLLCPKEVWGTDNICDSAANKTKQLDYYQINNVNLNNYNNIVKKNGGEMPWKLRNANSSDNRHFSAVNTAGKLTTAIVNNEGGISPAFRIG